VIILGGPNRSGKSAAALRLLRDELQTMEAANADQIAHGWSAFRPEAHSFEAGRVMPAQLRMLAERQDDFAKEKGYEFR
jgi:predicted ABC-type ATPase